VWDALSSPTPFTSPARAAACPYYPAIIDRCLADYLTHCDYDRFAHVVGYAASSVASGCVPVRRDAPTVHAGAEPAIGDPFDSILRRLDQPTSWI